MEGWNTPEPTRDTVNGAGSGVCELTNESKLLIWELYYTSFWIIEGLRKVA